MERLPYLCPVGFGKDSQNSSRIASKLEERMVLSRHIKYSPHYQRKILFLELMAGLYMLFRRRATFCDKRLTQHPDNRDLRTCIESAARRSDDLLHQNKSPWAFGFRPFLRFPSSASRRGFGFGLSGAAGGAVGLSGAAGASAGLSGAASSAKILSLVAR